MWAWRPLYQRLQIRLDAGPATFEEWRQSQRLAKGLHRLVGGKAGDVGGDFEQDAVGLAAGQEITEPARETWRALCCLVGSGAVNGEFAPGPSSPQIFTLGLDPRALPKHDGK